MSTVGWLGLDVHADTIAVAVAEPSGEVRSWGIIPKRPESIRRLVKKLGPAEQLRVCEHVANRLARLARAIDEAVTTAPPRMRAVIEALQALRGLALVLAVTIVAEGGAAWAYRHRPAVGDALRTRQAALSRHVTGIAWKAQHRLHARHRYENGADRPFDPTDRRFA